MSWSGDGAMFLDAPKALMGLCEFWCPICSWTGGAPWINIPNSLCAWITHAQHHLLLLSAHPARKAFLLRRKCLNRSFLHPYSTQPLWKCSCEQHVLVAHKDSPHPAVACQVQLLGDH